MKRYMQFVKPYNLQILLTIVIGIIKFAIPLFIPILIKIVIDDIIGGDMTSEEKMKQLVYWLGGTALVFLIVRPPIEYYRQYLAQLVSNKILYDIRQKLYSHDWFDECLVRFSNYSNCNWNNAHNECEVDNCYFASLSILRF
jgi:ABC-type multidrug transport system fused ATPase/permease subunit